LRATPRFNRGGSAAIPQIAGLLRRPAEGGTPRPAKSGNILAALNTFSASPICGISS